MSATKNKVTKKITEENILQICEFSETMPKHGDIMTYKKFKNYVDDGYIIDDDGFGELIIDGKVVKNANTYIDKGVFCFKNGTSISFETLYNIFGNKMKIVWYNR